MSRKGFLTSLALSVFMGGLSYFIKIPYTLILVGVFYCLMSLFLLKDKKMYIRIKETINRDAYREYEKKDKEFKTYIKDNAYSYLLIGLVFLYLGYRVISGIFSYEYSMIVSVVIFLNYLIEVYSMKSSKTWTGYKQKSGLLNIALVSIAMVLV